MDQNFPKISPEQLRQLASSPAARELMQMLRQNHGSAMDAALAGAKSGDAAAAQRALTAFLTDPRARDLLKQLQEDHHG